MAVLERDAEREGDGRQKDGGMEVGGLEVKARMEEKEPKGNRRR